MDQNQSFYQGGPQEAPQTPPPGPKPDNNLVWAILTIFCCWPIALGGIQNANKVDTLWAQGKYQEAEEAAKKAKKSALTAFIVGLIVQPIIWVLYIMLQMGR